MSEKIKIASYSLFTFIFLGSFMLFPKKTTALELPIYENFDDNNANDGFPLDWEEYPTSGVWTVDNGKYKGTITPGSIYPITLVGDNSWDDYAIEVTMKGLEGVDRHILFRFTDYHVLGYSVKYREANYGFPGHIELQKHDELVVLQSNNDFKSHIGENHRLRIEAVGNNIKVYVDGVLYINYTDNHNPTLKGKVGFHVEPSGSGLTTTTLYDDLSIEKIDTHTLDLTPLFQFSPPWWKETYDKATDWSDNSTISRWGCALTSAAMVLRYYNHNVTPGPSSDDYPDALDLNRWLTLEPDGYIRNGLLNWLAVSRFSLTNTRKIDPSKDLTILKYRRFDADNNIINTELDEEDPPIIKVPGHFVVVKGKDNSDYLINDPASETRTNLSEVESAYSGSYTTINQFDPTNTDLSYIMLVVDGDTNINVYNSDGNEDGKSFLEDSLVDDVDMTSTSGETLNIYLIPEPDYGEYKVQVEGGDGPFFLQSYLYDEDGKLVDLTNESEIPSYYGLSFDGLPTEIMLNYDDNPETKPLIHNITFDGMLTDLEILWKIGWINNEDVYVGLKDKLVAAKFLADFNIKASTNVLRAFKHLLNAQNNKAITPEAYDILLGNIDLLLNN